jgi:hypothetical protein
LAISGAIARSNALTPVSRRTPWSGPSAWKIVL